MKLRSLLVLIIAILLVMMPVATNAQDLDPCFGLAETDCSELNLAGQNLALFALSNQSFTVAYDLKFTTTGLPEGQAPASSVTFNSNGAVDVVIGGGEALPVTIGAAASADFGFGDMMQNEAVELRIVDDFVYVMMGEVWRGASLSEVASNPGGIVEEIESRAPFSMEEISAQMPDPATLMAFTTVLDLPGLISHVREGNDFIFTLDLTALGQLADPANADKLNELVAAANAVQPGSGEQIPMFIQLLPAMLQEGTITIVQSLNPEFDVIDNISLTVDAVVDGSSMGMGTEPINVSLGFNLGITNVNSAPTAVAPAEFEEVELEALMGGM
jgi:hypothetical protein